MKERNEYIGNDAHGEYKYYDIIDYDTCCNCKHFSDNWRYERFECFSKICRKENKNEIFSR